MKIGRYVALQQKIAFSSSLAIGVVLGIALLVGGGIEGSINLDIELSRYDSVWFLLGTPLIVTLLFLLFTPLSFLLHEANSRVWERKFGSDI